MRRQSPEYKARNKARAQTPGYKARVNSMMKVRRRSDPVFRLAECLRARIRGLIANKGGKTTENLLGCSYGRLVLHLELQFTPEMTWDNHGTVWHVDHVAPLPAFDLTDAHQLAVACNYENLRPMLASKNLAKGDTVEDSWAFWMLCYSGGDVSNYKPK